MQDLYAIERKAREEGYSPEQRKALRYQQALPIMDKLKAWLVDNRDQVLPKSSIGEAINYASNRWKYMERYLEDGKLEIDNNLVENAIRPVAVGRKNYLFAVRQERSYNYCGALLKMREPASRSRLAGAGFKLPYAA